MMRTITPIPHQNVTIAPTPLSYATITPTPRSHAPANEDHDSDACEKIKQLEAKVFGLMKSNHESEEQRVHLLK
jgi:hypothetical protein